MKYLQWAFWIIGLNLQLLVISAFLQGAVRQFPIIFGYCVCLLVTTVTDIGAYTLLGSRHPAYATYYWLAELIRQSGLFCVVISLVMDALPEGRNRTALLRTVVTGAFVLWAGSIIVHHHWRISLWMTRVVRDLSFSSAVVNLLLWFALISARQRDTRRLLITGGLGLQMTGEAIGQSIRQLSRSPVAVMGGNIIIVVTHFICLYIWWQAIRNSLSPAEKRRREVAEHSPIPPQRALTRYSHQEYT